MEKKKLIIGVVIVVVLIVFTLEIGTLLFWRLKGSDGIFHTGITPAASPLGTICLPFSGGNIPPGWREFDLGEADKCWLIMLLQRLL